MNICFRARLNQEGGRCGFRLAFTSEFLPPLKLGSPALYFPKQLSKAKVVLLPQTTDACRELSGLTLPLFKNGIP